MSSFCSHDQFRPLRAVQAFGVCALLVGFIAGCGERGGPLPAADDGSLRTTAQGPLIGYVGDYGSHVWRGIPYASPPVDDLRWRAPEPPSAWRETRDALQSGSFCPQFASRFGGVAGDEGEIRGSEDCLFLDIYAKRRELAAVPIGEDRVPVLVWIHGGGNVIGHAGFYNGGNMAETHDGPFEMPSRVQRIALAILERSI